MTAGSSAKNQTPVDVEACRAAIRSMGDLAIDANMLLDEIERLRARVALVALACAPLCEWLKATLPGAERLGQPGAIVGPAQVEGRDVGLTVAQARALFDALSIGPEP